MLTLYLTILALNLKLTLKSTLIIIFKIYKIFSRLINLLLL